MMILNLSEHAANLRSESEARAESEGALFRSLLLAIDCERENILRWAREHPTDTHFEYARMVMAAFGRVIEVRDKIEI